jgi:hypothetical protein
MNVIEDFMAFQKYKARHDDLRGKRGRDKRPRQNRSKDEEKIILLGAIWKFLKHNKKRI